MKHCKGSQCNLKHNRSVLPSGYRSEDVPLECLRGSDDAHFVNVLFRAHEAARKVPPLREQTFQAVLQGRMRAQAENPPDGPWTEYELLGPLIRHTCRRHRPRLDLVGRSAQERDLLHGALSVEPQWWAQATDPCRRHSPDRLAGGCCEREMVPLTRKCCRSSYLMGR